jgi:hypothetical protein
LDSAALTAEYVTLIDPALHPVTVIRAYDATVEVTAVVPFEVADWLAMIPPADPLPVPVAELSTCTAHPVTVVDPTWDHVSVWLVYPAIGYHPELPAALNVCCTVSAFCCAIASPESRASSSTTLIFIIPPYCACASLGMMPTCI